MRAALLALLAGLCLSAGCSGVVPSDAGPGSPTPTATPAPVPTEATLAGDLAPGVTADGIEDPDALLAAHQQVIEGEYVGLVTGAVYPTGGPGESRIHATIGPDGERFSVEDYRWHASDASPNGSAGAPDRIIRVYGDTEATYLRIEEGNETSYRRHPPARVDPAVFPHFDVEEVVRTIAVDRVRRTDNGVRIEGHPTETVGYALRATRPETVNVTVIVAPSGRLQYVELGYPMVYDGRTIRVVEYVNYVNVGAGGVAEPSWLPAAREATANETREPPQTHTATA